MPDTVVFSFNLFNLHKQPFGVSPNFKPIVQMKKTRLGEVN